MSGVQLIPTRDVIIPLGLERSFSAGSEFDSAGDPSFSGLRILNAKCLVHFGMRPHQVSILPRDWREWPGADGLVDEIRSYLHASRDWQGDLQKPSGGIDILAPLYAEALKREGIVLVTFVICFSNPLKLFEGVNDVRRAGLYLKYLLNALAGTRGHYRRVVPASGYSAAVDITQVPPPPSMPDFSGWPSILRDVYQMCITASQEPIGLNEGKFDSRIESLCNELRVIDDMANAVDLPEDKMTLSWKGGKVEEAYCPTGSWQTMRFQLSAPAGSMMQFDPYQTPCYFWIRKAVWHTASGEKPALFAPQQNGFLEEVEDLQRLSIFGPGPASLESVGPAELEIELLVQANDVILKELLLAIKGRLDEKGRKRR